jgi:hypothetical protein
MSLLEQVSAHHADAAGIIPDTNDPTAGQVAISRAGRSRGRGSACLLKRTVGKARSVPRIVESRHETLTRPRVPIRT